MQNRSIGVAQFEMCFYSTYVSLYQVSTLYRNIDGGQSELIQECVRLCGPPISQIQPPLLICSIHRASRVVGLQFKLGRQYSLQFELGSSWQKHDSASPCNLMSNDRWSDQKSWNHDQTPRVTWEVISLYGIPWACPLLDALVDNKMTHALDLGPTTSVDMIQNFTLTRQTRLVFES